MHISDSSATRAHLTLYLPGILSAPRNRSDGSGGYRALETLLARAERNFGTFPAGYEAGLFSLFGIFKEDNADLPVAAVTRALDMGIIDNGWWLRADPVHLSLERDRLILADAPTLDITPDEANRLVAEIMEVFNADGWLLKAPRPDRWYLKPAHAPKITTTPLSQVTARDVHPFLPQGPDGKNWHTTLNEVQILLHTAAVNAEREKSGKLPINSLWFWGGGCLPRIPPASWARIWSREPISLALARLSDTPSENPPGGFDDWRHRAGPADEHLVVLEDAHRPACYGMAEQWNAVLQRFEEGWMTPLLRALKDGAIGKATLVADDGSAFALTPRQARRWWHRRQALAAYQAPRIEA